MSLSERPNCPVHKKVMIPWQLPTKDSVQGVVYGFTCAEPGCKLRYSDDIGGYFTLTLDGTPIPYQEPA